MSTTLHSKFIQSLLSNKSLWGIYTRSQLAEMATKHCGYFVSEEQVRVIQRRHNALDFTFKRSGIMSKVSSLKQESTMSKTKKELTAEARLEGQLRAVKEAKNQDDKRYKAVIDDNARLQKALDKALFKNEKRITWTMDNSYHSYVQVYDKRIRFNHGHLGWRYNMGLGGVHGPLWLVGLIWSMAQS